MDTLRKFEWALDNHNRIQDRATLVKVLKRWLLTCGIITSVLAGLAIIMPHLATLAIEILLAVVFIAAASVQLLFTRWQQPAKGLAMELVLAGLYATVGILFLVYPIRGILTLTLLLTAFFIIIGAAKIALGLHLWPSSASLWTLGNGVIALLIGVFIWISVPESASWLIGLLVGIDLLFSGVTMIIQGLSLHDKPI